MDLARKIAKLRMERGLSQRDLARQVQLSCSTIALYETGHKSPSPKSRARLAQVLGVPLRELMPEWQNAPEDAVVITEPELVTFIKNYRLLSPQAREAMLTTVQTVALMPMFQTRKKTAR